MVRWRGVSTDSAGRTARAESALGVSLSLIRTNVAAFSLIFKHVFEVCRGSELTSAAESCRWPDLWSSACTTVRSHVRFSNTLSTTLRTHDRPRADWRNAHDAHRDDLAESVGPGSPGSGTAVWPGWPTGIPRPPAVQAGRCASALSGHRGVDVDGVAPAPSDHPGDDRGARPGRSGHHGVAGICGALRRHAARRSGESRGSDA